MMNLNVQDRFKLYTSVAERQSTSNNIHSNPNNHKNSPSFQNAAVFSALGSAPVVGTFKLLTQDPIWGLSTVDMLSMILPRTAVDAKRNPLAGVETFRRESSGLIVHCLLPGVVAFGISAMISKGIENKYNVNAKHLMATDDEVDAYCNTMKKAGALKSEERTKAFVETVLNNSKGLDGDNNWVKATDKAEVSRLADSIKDIIHNDKKGFKIDKKQKKEILSSLGKTLGSRESIQVELDGKKISTNAENLLNNMHFFGKAMNSNKVVAEADINGMIKEFKGANKKKAAIAIALICALSASVQKINRNLTKKKTGSDNFVGYSDADNIKVKKDKATVRKEKAKLTLLKGLSTAGMLGIAYLALGKPKGIKGLKALGQRMQFKSWFPSTDQIKVIYAVGIIGRIWAGSDKNEVRETSFRDYLGYTNWLILGSVVTKKVATLLDKKGLINTIKNGAKTEESVKTLSEIADKNLPKNLEKALLGKRVVAEAAGLLYSCLALGLVVPKINEYWTKKTRAKEKALAGVQTPQPQTKSATKAASFAKTTSITDKLGFDKKASA